jgi:hypothetical protein
VTDLVALRLQALIEQKPEIGAQAVQATGVADPVEALRLLAEKILHVETLLRPIAPMEPMLEGDALDGVDAALEAEAGNRAPMRARLARGSNLTALERRLILEEWSAPPPGFWEPQGQLANPLQPTENSGGVPSSPPGEEEGERISGRSQ